MRETGRRTKVKRVQDLDAASNINDRLKHFLLTTMKLLKLRYPTKNLQSCAIIVVKTNKEKNKRKKERKGGNEQDKSDKARRTKGYLKKKKQTNKQTNKQKKMESFFGRFVKLI